MTIRGFLVSRAQARGELGKAAIAGKDAHVSVRIGHFMRELRGIFGLCVAALVALSAVGDADAAKKRKEPPPQPFSRPEIILTWDRNFFEQVRKDALWAGIRAVREQRVYLAPTAPFGWIDRPPSLNRVIGLKWLVGLFYPDKFSEDLREITRSFYSLFYHVDLGELELDTLIAWSRGQAPSAPRRSRH